MFPQQHSQRKGRFVLAAEALDASLPRLDAIDVALGWAESIEVPLGLSDSIEVPLGCSDSMDVPLGASDSMEVPLGRSDTEVALGAALGLDGEALASGSGFTVIFGILGCGLCRGEEI